MRAREQIYVLLKDAKWIIAVSLLLAVVLGVPDQIKELYRIEYSDSITAQGFVAFPLLAPARAGHSDRLHGLARRQPDRL